MSELKKPKREDFIGSKTGFDRMEARVDLVYAEVAYERACKELAIEALEKTECMFTALCKSGVFEKCPRCSALAKIRESEKR